MLSIRMMKMQRFTLKITSLLQVILSGSIKCGKETKDKNKNDYTDGYSSFEDVSAFTTSPLIVYWH